MHHGELILRQPRLDELFWVCTFALCLIPWSLSRPYLGQEGMTAGILATLAVLAAVLVTLLKNWNIRRVAWGLEEPKCSAQSAPPVSAELVELLAQKILERLG